MKVGATSIDLSPYSCVGGGAVEFFENGLPQGLKVHWIQSSTQSVKPYAFPEIL